MGKTQFEDWLFKVKRGDAQNIQNWKKRKTKKERWHTEKVYFFCLQCASFKSVDLKLVNCKLKTENKPVAKALLFSK